MFRKINLKWLLILFGILFLLVLLTQILKNKGSNSNFNSKPLVIDTTKISDIYIKHKSDKNEIKITRSGKAWNLLFEGKNIRPDKQAIHSILNELANIQADRIAATDKNEWPTYEVTDTADIKVRVEQKGKVIANFIVGKFLYQQNPQKFTTFIRLQNETDVYSIQGFLSMSFGRGINDLRDKTLVNIDPSSITQVTFTYPSDSSYTLEKDNKVWKIGPTKLDSAKIQNYILALARLNSYDIIGNTAIQGKEIYSVKIEGNNITPIHIKAFESDTTTKILITSSMNSDTQFYGAKGELLNQIFVSKRNFFTPKKKR